jgi:hypothetical protein
MERPPERTRDQIELDLLVELSIHEWHDVTEVCPDPSAIQCFAYGINGKRHGPTVYMLSRYEDGGAEFALVSYVDGREEGKAVATEQFKLQWLWQQVINGESDA